MFFRSTTGFWDSPQWISKKIQKYITQCIRGFFGKKFFLQNWFWNLSSTSGLNLNLKNQKCLETSKCSFRAFGKFIEDYLIDPTTEKMQKNCYQDQSIAIIITKNEAKQRFRNLISHLRKNTSSHHRWHP
jgi:hypothetical protein